MRIALVGAELEENLAVRYIRAALEQDGHEVIQLQFNGPEETEAVALALVENAPAITGLSMVFTARAREFLALAARARVLGYRGHIVAGGHFAALNAEALLRDVPALDSVAQGEGEAIACELARHLDDPSRVAGLVCRREDGAALRSGGPARPADLDALPWPVRRRPPDSYLGLPIVNMLQSRGCTHACAFCSIAAWHRFCGGPRHRMRRVDDVAAEMAALHAEGVRIFNFHDDNFLLPEPAAALARIEALGQALRARGVGRIAFAIKARPDEVAPALFSKLRELGLFRVFLGIEAGTAESLRRLGRGQTIDDNERALDVVNGLGLHACFNLLLLNPDSTLEDMAANVAFLRRRPDNPMNFCRTEIYAGTPLETKLRREGRLIGDYFGWDYRIADPRAELACVLTYRVFEPRNYGLRCLHHRTMNLDYENTLRRHFGGADEPRAGGADELTAAVKGFVRRANLNTCGYLEEVMAVAAGGADELRQARFVHDVAPRMRTDEKALGEEADALLAEVRRRSATKPLAPVRRRSRTAVAGLAASMVVAACRATPTAASEMAPEHSRVDEPRPAKPPLAQDAGAPREPTAPATAPTHYSEIIARPPKPVPPAAPDAGRPAAPAEPPTHFSEMIAAPPRPVLPDGLEEKVLDAAARQMKHPVPLRLRLTLDTRGKVSKVDVETPRNEAKKIAAAVRKLSFGPEARPLAGEKLQLEFSADRVDAARTPKRPSFHETEMVPND